MSRDEVIEQLIALKKEYQDTGEMPSKLWGHFAYEFDHGEVVWVEEDGKVVAFCDFSWIDGLHSLEHALIGNKTLGGDILCILTIVTTGKGQLKKLKKLLPKHRYIVGLHEDTIHAPKGLPELEGVI